MLNKADVFKNFRQKGFIWAIVAIAFLGLVLRLSAIILVPTQPVSDFWSLFTRANNLHDLNTFNVIPGQPEATFTPLYPLLLSGSFSIQFDRLVLAKLVNVILGVISIILVAGLASLIAGTKVGMIAALIQAFYPRSILMPLLIAAENLFIPLLLLWAILIAYTLRKDKNTTPLLICLGIVSGLLTLTRSVAYLLWAIVPLISLIKGTPILKVLKEFIFLALISHLVLLPWGIRNYEELGSFTVLNSTGGVDLFIGNNKNATGMYYSWQGDIIQQDPNFFQHDLIERDSIARKIAVNYMWGNPGKTIRLYAIKLAQMFQDERFVGDFAISYGLIEPPWPAAAPLQMEDPIRLYGPLVRKFLNYAYFGLSILEITGAIFLFLRKKNLPLIEIRWIALTVLISGLYFPIVAALFHSTTRYRWPFTDLMIPFAAFMIFSIFSKKHPT